MLWFNANFYYYIIMMMIQLILNIYKEFFAILL